MTIDFALSADQEVIKDLFSGFLANECRSDVVRAAEPLGFDPELWEKLGALGAYNMGTNEEVGGGGASLADLAVVAEELGRAAAPVPLVEHLVATRALGASEPDMLDDSTIATVALHPMASGAVWRLVPAGAVAGVVVGRAGDSTIAVRSSPPKSGPRNHASLPIADRSATGDEVRAVGGIDTWAAAITEWKVLTAAALVGISNRAVELAVDYAKERHQFGRPIAAFQAVQHGLADLPGLIDGARLLVHKAAWAHDQIGRHEPPPTEAVTGDDLADDSLSAPALALMAFIFASDVASTVTDRALHYHGGFGYAAESDIQLYYRRARGWPLIFDSVQNECARLADELFGPASDSRVPGMHGG